MPYRALALISALTIGCASTGVETRSSVRIEERDGRLVVTQGGELVTEFRFEGERVPSLYPLIGPGGVPVTRAWPFEEREGEQHDHPHHVSLWLAHGDVDGHDFWHDADCSIVRTGGALTATGDDVSIVSVHRWQAGDTPVLIEERTMSFELEADRRAIDFDFVLSGADGAVTFGDTKEGSFAIRMHPDLRLRGDRAKGTARNSEGVSGREVWGKRARWVAYSAPVEGNELTVILMDHPGNLRHPTWWHARDYGLCAANPFGVHDFEKAPEGSGDYELPAGESLRLRYRVLVLAGRADDERIHEEWGAFAR